jgi:hypothetical protein
VACSGTVIVEELETKIDYGVLARVHSKGEKSRKKASQEKEGVEGIG